MPTYVPQLPPRSGIQAANTAANTAANPDPLGAWPGLWHVSSRLPRADLIDAVWPTVSIIIKPTPEVVDMALPTLAHLATGLGRTTIVFLSRSTSGDKARIMFCSVTSPRLLGSR